MPHEAPDVRRLRRRRAADAAGRVHDYRFECRAIDGKTFLIVSSIETKKEILRVRCGQEALNARVSDSGLRSTIPPDGVRVLQSVRIRGEQIAHRIVE